MISVAVKIRLKSASYHWLTGYSAHLKQNLNLEAEVYNVLPSLDIILCYSSRLFHGKDAKVDSNEGQGPVSENYQHYIHTGRRLVFF